MLKLLDLPKPQRVQLSRRQLGKTGCSLAD
jgi:hypothetical protein